MTGFDADMYRRLVESSPEGVVLVDAQIRSARRSMPIADSRP